MRPAIILGGGALLLLLFSGGGSSSRPVPSALLMRSEGLIRGLHESIQPFARKLIEAAYEAGISVIVASGARSIEEQNALYEQGRTTPGAIVTPVKGGSSWHNYGLAFDLAPLNDLGKPHWPAGSEPWVTLGKLGESLGLRWGGRFPTPDVGHFEYHPGLTIADARAGQRPTRTA